MRPPLVRTATALAVAALLTTMTTGAGRPAAGKPCTPAWHLVNAPAAANGASSEVSAAAALSATDARFAGTTEAWQARNLSWDGGSLTDSARQMPTFPRQYLFVEKSMSFDSAASGWAIVDLPFSPVYATRLMRWYDGRWTLTPGAPSPDPTTMGTKLYQVDSLAPNSAWAVGYYKGAGSLDDPIGALIEHWDGRSWKAVDNPADHRPDTRLSSVAAVSDTDVWAVGEQTTDAGRTPLALHYDGSTWTDVPVPTGGRPWRFTDISATGPNDLWAVGSALRDGTQNEATSAVMHYDGHGWSRVSGLPDTGNSQLESVYAAAPDDVWAVGDFFPRSEEAFLHFNGSTWEKVATPKTINGEFVHNYTAITGTSGADVWAVGVVYDESNLDWFRPLIARLSCGGR